MNPSPSFVTEIDMSSTATTKEICCPLCFERMLWWDSKEEYIETLKKHCLNKHPGYTFIERSGGRFFLKMPRGMRRKS